MDFEELFTPDEKLEVEIVTLSGVTKIEVTVGMTIADFKSQNNLDGYKVMDENNRILRDSDTINESQQFFVTRPKQNG